MRSQKVGVSALRWLLSLALLLAVVPHSQGQTKPDLSGRYTCAEFKVRGQVRPCKSAPLILKSNGRYEIHGREGEYITKGNWLMLSNEGQHGRARIGPGHAIVFRYRCGQGPCEIKFERRIAELGDTGLS